MPTPLHALPQAGADPAIRLTYATISGRADTWFFVRPAAGDADRALRAESCLLEPQCGDMVLISQDTAPGSKRPPYILAILSRTAPTQGTLTLPGGVRLESDRGQLRTVAEHAILEARQHLTISAPELTLAGDQGDIRVARLQAEANTVEARLGTLQLLAQQVQSSVGRLVQKARDCCRWIENLDETRAGRVRLQVQERFDLRARHAAVLAQGQVKIDGDKIDLG